MAKVVASIIDKVPAHSNVTANEIMLDRVRKEIPNATEQSLISTLSYLRAKGMLYKSEVQGLYHRSNGTKHEPQPQPPDMELVVIDNLLAAMAAAEPVLKECKKVITMIRSFK